MTIYLTGKHPALVAFSRYHLIGTITRGFLFLFFTDFAVHNRLGGRTVGSVDIPGGYDGCIKK